METETPTDTTPLGSDSAVTVRPSLSGRGAVVADSFGQQVVLSHGELGALVQWAYDNHQLSGVPF